MRKAEGLRLKAEGSQIRSPLDARHATLGTIQQHTVTPSLRAPSRPSRWMRPLLPSAFRLQPSAFTLIELVSVLAIVCLLLSIALGAYISWTRAGSIDAGANQLAATLDHARELAITQRLNTHVICSNTNIPGRPPRGAYAIEIWQSETNTDVWIPATQPGLLPADVYLRDLPSATAITNTFFPDGTCYPVTNLCVAVSSSGSRLNPRIIEIQPWRLRVRREDQP